MRLTLVQWKLRQIMADKRMQNIDLAKALNVHPNTISRWKLSDEMPRISGAEIDKLCEILKCSVGQLLGMESLNS